MRATFFGHFVGGVDGDEIKPLVKQLKHDGITGMVVYNAEEDLAGEKMVPEKNVRMGEEMYYHENEAKSDVNMKNTIDCIDTAAGIFL